MATHYTFITRWQIRAPLTQVWDTIYHSLEWPAWWRGVVHVKEIEKGEENDIGSVREYTWRGILPYQLVFNVRLTEIEKYKRMKGEAFGELEGTGQWFFEEHNGVTRIQYNWIVHTHKKWMNYFTLILKPAFTYNHNIVMRWGAKGLAKKLNAELLSC
jgi:hypothetical protein